MNTIAEFLTRHLVQCWACPVFDQTLITVSAAAAGAYEKLAQFALILLSAFIAFYTLYIVFTRLSQSGEDPLYTKTIKPVLINSMVIVSLIAMGPFVPRMVTRLTLEPTAMFAQGIASVITPIDSNIEYTPMPMSQDGFYTPEFKNRVIAIMLTTTTAFQNFIMFGLKMIEHSLDLKKLFTWNVIGALMETLFMFLLGLVIVYGFARLFLKFLFYFVDTIIALTLFAFMFPIMLVAFVMRHSEAPSWVTTMGGMSETLFKRAAGSVITLGSAVILYVVIISVISGFLDGAMNGDLTRAITNGDFSNIDFQMPEILRSAAGIGILLLVMGFITGKMQMISDEIKSAFGINEGSTPLGGQTYEAAARLKTGVVGQGKKAWNFVTKKKGAP
ncbi:MAG: hypothetical protein FWD33_04340 [Alphaproteobacteria bacterium]|nr:hypothetical protein [Alphaproteobacteria bacterium]